jgi:hypothetical protein
MFQAQGLPANKVAGTLRRAVRTIVAGTLRRAVRRQAFAKIPGGRHMECAYYFVDGTWNVPTTLWTAHGMCLLLCGRHIECAYYVPTASHSP